MCIADAETAKSATLEALILCRDRLLAEHITPLESFKALVELARLGLLESCGGSCSKIDTFLCSGEIHPDCPWGF